MRPLVTIFFGVSLALQSAAAVRGDHAGYLGGTLQIPKGVQGEFDLRAMDALRFRYNGAVSVIPYNRITSMEFGEKVGRRVGLAMMVGWMALMSEKKKHFLTIGFQEESGAKGTAIWELSKEIFQSAVPVLEARTGKRVEINHTTGDDFFDTPRGAEVLHGIVANAAQEMAPVTFISTRPGAAVSFYGQNAGSTPLTTKLSAGSYKVTVSATGYRTWTQEINVEAGKSLSVSAEMQAQ